MCWEMMAGIGFEWHLPRRGTTNEYGLFCVAVALEACAALCSELREWFMKMTVMPKPEYAYEEDAFVLSNQILSPVIRSVPNAVAMLGGYPLSNLPICHVQFQVWLSWEMASHKIY